MLFFSKISSVIFLFIAIFLMRFSGQGMMSHTATTTISRYFKNLEAGPLALAGLVFHCRIYFASFGSLFINNYIMAEYMGVNFYFSFNIFTHLIFSFR